MKVHPSLTPDLASWAMKQPVFFVATAPTYGRHVNVSPKGAPQKTLRLDSASNGAVYLDRTGSGCETLAHLYENGRLTMMFMSFGPAPRILRLYCRLSEVVEWTDADRFRDRLGASGFGRLDAARAVVALDVFKVTTSCGFGVPMVRRALYRATSSSSAVAGKAAKGKEGEGDEEGEGEEGPAAAAAAGGGELSVFEDRPTLDSSAAKIEGKGMALDFQAAYNADSLDGLPGLRAGRRKKGRWLVVGEARAWGRRVGRQVEGMAVGFLLAVIVWLLAGAFARAGGREGVWSAIEGLRARRLM